VFLFSSEKLKSILKKLDLIIRIYRNPTFIQKLFFSGSQAKYLKLWIL